MLTCNKNEYDKLQEDILYFIRTMATDFDHYEDAHKYRTLCYVCEAEELNRKLEIKFID